MEAPPCKRLQITCRGAVSRASQKVAINQEYGRFYLGYIDASRCSDFGLVRSFVYHLVGNCYNHLHQFCIDLSPYRCSPGHLRTVPGFGFDPAPTRLHKPQPGAIPAVARAGPSLVMRRPSSKLRKYPTGPNWSRAAWSRAAWSCASPARGGAAAAVKGRRHIHHTRRRMRPTRARRRWRRWRRR